jgi:hypothetical protein
MKFGWIAIYAKLHFIASLKAKLFRGTSFSDLMKIIQPVESNFISTDILDYDHPVVKSVVDRVEIVSDCRKIVQNAHQLIAGLINPIYTVDEHQKVSAAIQKGRGSCSQRMACLEACSRALGIGTRARALWISGSFWAPRFTIMKIFIPSKVLLIWPQFHIENNWIDFDELYEEVTDETQSGIRRFANSDETIFDAISHTHVDLLGKSSVSDCNTCKSTSDLTEYLIEDVGFYDTRDQLLSSFGSFQSSFRGRMFELLYGNRKSY